MKRPKTYRFSELWTDHHAENLTRECRTDRPLRRRPGRPTGKRFQQRARAMLNRIKRLLEGGYTVVQVAEMLDIPQEVLAAWALEEV